MGRLLLRILVIVAALLIGPNAFALIPIMYTDEQIAQSPVIVIGYWPKAEFKPHERQVGDTIEESEAFTKLRIVRVLRGRVPPGEVKLMINGGIGWEKSGKGLTTAMSTMIPGDVDDVSKPCIWFLDRAHSWDAHDKSVYLHVKQFQFVQPMKLLEYFKVLMRPDRDTAIAHCLLGGEPEVVRRSLEFVSGWKEPWPYSPSPKDNNPQQLEMYRYFNNQEPKTPRRLYAQGNNVAEVIEHGPSGCRGFATAVYVDLRDSRCLPKLRLLVKDSNPEVALVAAGYLVQFQDPSMADAIAAACRQATNADLACEVALGMMRSKDPALWAGLFDFLDCGANAGIGGDDIRTPALYAQAALRKLTGYTFPLASDLSKAAWHKVERLSGRAKAQMLESILGNWDHPISATWSVDKTQKRQPREDGEPRRDTLSATVKLTNATGSAIRITRYPFDIDVRTPNSSSGSSSGEPASPITLEPGASIEVPIWIDAVALKAGKEIEVTLQYTKMDRAQGAIPWTGVVKPTRVANR